MNPLDLLSAVAVLAASVPPLYFAVRLQGPRTASRVLVLLLAAAFLVHGAFHLLDAFDASPDLIQAVEALSAILILAFALVYWPLRGRTDL